MVAVLMGASSRRKGVQGERAVSRIFRDAGHRVENLQRNEGGNCDCIVNDTFYVDSKRVRRVRVPEWWAQAREQAPAGTVPVVAFRQDHGEWLALLPLDAFAELLT